MKRMLINATQAEERRMAVVDGQKLLDFEIEIEGREQRKGNIYKAVVTRVEPSLEACFVDYGEDRHGFLPFKEVNKIYFSSKVSPSQAKIQDVISEGQEMIVQVDKEERGNKGAALTTNVSLAGRYIVLMPNNPRGGGVSRRIEGEDRAELKEALDQLEYPNGMSVIARTAGIGRGAEELQWDLNYLLKLWQAIEDAAAGIGKDSKEKLIYQESSLVIRAIRDYFNHDIGDILIDTKDIYDQAKGFMSYVMPEYAERVKLYTDDTALFSRFQIEHQIESAYSRTVQLPSGGAIVIDHTEALVAVDVNSARSIKGSHIEDTATRTNMEAAEEVARQMRLRDLGGLIVIDFIDMEESKNRRDVENRLRDSLRQDRARVQFGSISKFGLLEMSRQRLRPSLSEGASIPCPRCGGSGHIRDTESSALQILRVIQEESIKDATAAIHVQVPVEVASFLLNEKRNEIAKIELQQRVDILMIPNKQLETPNYRLERLKQEDARLENQLSSYKRADEVEDPTEITRKPRERTNKQEPLIKGILHDSAAPTREKAPVAVSSSGVQDKRSASGASTTPQASTAAPVAASVASEGLFGWVRKIFAKTDAPSASSRAADSSQSPKADSADKAAPDNAARPSRNDRNRQNRESRDGRGGRDGRNGERSPRDARSSPKLGLAQQPESVESTDAPVKSLAPRRGRNGNGNSNSNGNNATGNSAPRTNSSPDNIGAEGENSKPASARNGRNSRSGRGAQDKAVESLMPAAEALDTTVTPVQAMQEQANAPVINALPLANASIAQALDTNENSLNTEKPVKRERKSRDRYGRDRRERNASTDEAITPSDVQNEAPGAADAAQPSIEATPANSTVARASTPVQQPGAQKRTERETTSPGAATAQPLSESKTETESKTDSTDGRKATDPSRSAAQSALPKVSAFNLPIADLEQVATANGLQWVRSNPERIAEVQAAIAAETPPVRTPRVRPAAVVVDDKPLVLVETRLDLHNLDLPFNAATSEKSS